MIEIVRKGLSPRWALVLIAAATLAASCTTTSTPSSTATTAPPKAQPAATAPAQPAPAATVVPTGAPEANLPPFSCENKKQVFGQGPQPMPSLVRDVRVANDGAFDRFVIELDALQWAEVTPGPAAVFVTDPKGEQVKLLGSAGLRLVVFGATNDGKGQTDLKLNGPSLLEARQIGNFEGVLSWGLGLSKTPCFRVVAMNSEVQGPPTKLVVDIRH